MSNYAIEFIVTPEQIDALIAIDPAMETLFNKAVLNGVLPLWDDSYSGTRYRFKPGGAALVGKTW